MSNVRRVYVEKKPAFAVKAKELKHEIKHYLGISTVTAVRELIRYDVENISDEVFEKACKTVFAEPPVDDLYLEKFDVAEGARVFSVEFLPGQFDQRADSAVQCVQFLDENAAPIIRSATTYVIEGTVTDAEFEAIKHHCINPVDSRETGLEKPETLVTVFPDPEDVKIFDGFKDMAEADLKELYASLNLAMTFKDFQHIQNYFRNEEKRDPSMTEIRVLDTYWSDHCRHTTFSTELTSVKFDEGDYKAPIEKTYEEYLDKLGTGAVLGMVDQWWQFYYNLAEPYETNGLSDLGCDYVPLPITMDKGTSNQWHTSRNAEMDTSSGLSITTSCEDVQGALQFVNDLLDSDITKLRFWGEKDLDYSVDENGMFYMNSEQGKRHGDSVLNESHFCPYSYFPRVEGLLDDGINAFSMEYQPVEFMKSLKPDIRECFEAYGVQNYVELLGTNEAPGAWYPMYSYTQSLSSKSKGGMIRDEIDAVKRSWLPQVIMSDDFASTWDAYMAAYQECNPQDYFDILQRHVDQILQ